jgi:hypothetical protein
MRLPVALLAALLPSIAASEEPAPPIWQPAIYCAALDLTRSDILSETRAAVPPAAGSAAAAARSGRAYLRIAAEDLGCPGQAQLDAMLETARIGIRYRLDLAREYGIGPTTAVLPLASESELVCALNFDPNLLAAARAAEAATPPAPLCGDG